MAGRGAARRQQHHLGGRPDVGPGRHHRALHARVADRHRARCVVGHNAHLEGCTIADDALIGSGSVVLHRAVVESWALVGASALVPNGMVVPSRAMALGVPAKLRKGAVTDEMVTDGVAMYIANARRYPTRCAASTEQPVSGRGSSLGHREFGQQFSERRRERRIARHREIVGRRPAVSTARHASGLGHDQSRGRPVP